MEAMGWEIKPAGWILPFIVIILLALLHHWVAAASFGSESVKHSTVCKSLGISFFLPHSQASF